MCMNNVHLTNQSSTLNISMIKTEEWPPNRTSFQISSSENSFTSIDDNDIIEFGPIKVKRRKKPAPTLATGRRSKYEILIPEEAYKRDLRRARNRAAAERVRINRLNVEQELQGQIDQLEDQEQKLLHIVEMLRCQKLQLETRIQTHDKLCSDRPFSNSQNHVMSTFLSNSAPTSTSFHQISSPFFDDLFSDLPTPVQSQPDNTANSLTTIIPGDELDIFLMDI